MSEIKPHIASIAWFPPSKALLQEAKDNYQRHIYIEKNCARCEYLSERHTDTCDECPNHVGHFILWKKKKDKETGKLTAIGLPTGNRKLLRAVTGGVKLKDRRCVNPMRHAIKFTGEFRNGQDKAVEVMSRKGYGLLKAPPRSGKTVMGIAIACKLGYKTLILANQNEFLSQFLETVVGNKANKIKPLTNANKFGGDGSVVGICKTEADFAKYDICLATYQTFLSERGKKLLKKIAPMFGTVIIDEAHKVAARCFLSVVNQFPAKCRIGLTGTPERKDKKDALTEYVLGPVVYEMEVQTMVPRVQLIETGVKLGRSYKLWTYFETALVDHVERNRLIIKHAVADIKAGRSIVIPVTRVHHAMALAKAINKVMGENVATHFVGSQKAAERKAIIEKARNGLVSCVVGIRSLIQLGINVPKWDMLYEVMPISNPPNFEQETARVRTPDPDKPQPIIKHFIDNESMARGCLRTCYWNTYRPLGFQVNDRDLMRIKAYMMKGDVSAPGNARKIAF